MAVERLLLKHLYPMDFMRLELDIFGSAFGKTWAETRWSEEQRLKKGNFLFKDSCSLGTRNIEGTCNHSHTHKFVAFPCMLCSEVQDPYLEPSRSKPVKCQFGSMRVMPCCLSTTLAFLPSTLMFLTNGKACPESVVTSTVKSLMAMGHGRSFTTFHHYGLETSC